MRSAFTLIELLTVVAVVSLMAALLLPALSKARAEAARLACANNLRQFAGALNIYRSHLGRYPDIGDRDASKRSGTRLRPMPPLARWDLAAIGDVCAALVADSLRRPEAMYCPTSLRNDRFAPAPFAKSGGSVVSKWTSGAISYVYMVGLLSTMTFTDKTGNATFDPQVEAPDAIIGFTRRLNRLNPRVMLAGDRAVELQPGIKNVPGSNHGKEGGWFAYTTGDVLWRNWNLLTPHPAPTVYIWYWPSLRTRSAP